MYCLVVCSGFPNVALFRTKAQDLRRRQRCREELLLSKDMGWSVPRSRQSIGEVSLAAGGIRRTIIDAARSKEDTKKIYSKDVDSLVDESGAGVAFSKSVFAERIHKGAWTTKPDFSSFGVIAGFLEQVLDVCSNK